MSANGTAIPLTSIATISERHAPLVVNHIGQFPSSTISFNLAEGAFLGDAIAAIEQAKQNIGLPISIQANFQGATLAFSASLSNTLWLIIATIITVYIVLGGLIVSQLLTLFTTPVLIG